MWVCQQVGGDGKWEGGRGAVWDPPKLGFSGIPRGSGSSEKKGNFVSTFC